MVLQQQYQHFNKSKAHVAYSLGHYSGFNLAIPNPQPTLVSRVFDNRVAFD